MKQAHLVRLAALALLLGALAGCGSRPGAPAAPAVSASPAVTAPAPSRPPSPGPTPPATSTATARPTAGAPATAALAIATPAPPPTAPPRATPTPLVGQPPDRLGTALPPGSDTMPESFPIFGISSPGATPGSGPGSYERAAREAAARDLASRRGVTPHEVSVVAREDREVPVADPCGTGKTPAGGLSVGLVLELESSGTRYRYVAVGGRGYYCGEA